jgi:4-amino-4-deoxy-L-arabinose transferase-like glycosyltransferase
MIEQWSRGVRPYFLLAILSLALYLPGLAAIPVTDRDEARFAQATRQMIESGDYLRIRFRDEARNKKPAGIYWLQAASVGAFSDAESGAIWPYRLPSLAGALAAVLLTFALGRRLVGPDAALIGASLLAASLELTVEAHLAKTDTVLLALAVAAQGALGILYRGGRAREPAAWGWALLFWAAQGLAILVKGPVVPVLSILTAAALSIADRDVRWLGNLRAAWGVPVLLAIAGPWLVAIEVATGGGFVAEAVGHDFLGKLIGAQESHGAPPLTHLLILLVAFWPGTLFLGRAIRHGWRERRDIPVRFLIAWAIPFWILLELVPTKLPQYLLPAYPALALMTGQALVAQVASASRSAWLDLAGLAIWAVVTAALIAGLVAAPLAFGPGIDGVSLLAAILLATIAAIVIFRAGLRGSLVAPMLAVLGAIVALAPLGQAVVPQLDSLFLSRQIGELARRAIPSSNLPLAVIGYDEPSLVFTLGTATEFLPPDQAAAALARGKIAAVAVVAGARDAEFRAAASRLGLTPRPAGTVSGLDYSNGKQLSLTLYRGP